MRSSPTHKCSRSERLSPPRHSARSSLATAAARHSEYDVGELEGRADPDAWAAYADLERRWLLSGEGSVRHLGGESADEVVARVRDFLARCARTPRGSHPAAAADPLEEPVVAVCHGGLLRLALPRVASGLDAAEWFRTRVPNCGVVLLRPDGTVRGP